jgi:UDP-galactopyranose mutase
MIPRILVVGAGFSGAVVAERVAAVLGRRVLVIDRRVHVAGNAYDPTDSHGVVIHEYGPHIFHTNAPHVAEYLSRFTSWRPYEHRVRGLVDGEWVPLPFNMTSFEILFGEVEGQRLIKLLTDEFGIEVKAPILKMRESASRDVRRIADLIYEKVFLHYTKKQWGLTPEELDASVSARVPVHLSRDDRYFQDAFQFMPSDGYLPIFRRMLDHPLIEVRTSMSHTDVIGTETFAHIVFTGPIDEYFDCRHGALPYRSIRFDMRAQPAAEPVQRWTVENYPTPASRHPFTRSTEFRLLTGQTGVDWTTCAYEYPEAYVPGMNEPHYPIPREENRALFRLYETDTRKLASVSFVGRLADYNYYNMDQAVASALACFEKRVAPKLTGIAA